MKSRLDNLLAKAAAAEPPEKAGRSDWRPFMPIVNLLMKERAHSLTDAVDWLVKEGEIPNKKRTSAYRSFRQIIARRQSNKSA